jgi:hypothetical protein
MNLFARSDTGRLRKAFASLLVVASMTAASLAAADIPRPEHPRPDARRDQWLSLNGEWQFEIDLAADGAARGLAHGRDLPLRINVPFPPQSALSGLARTGDYRDLWYRRHFEVPAAMAGHRVLLHFGAVDYLAEVFMNGQAVGRHVGGSASFAFDITPFLQPGENELVVRVHDDLHDGVQPKGKQSLKSEGCVYTATSGIWQPVWLEGVGTSYIRQPAIATDVAASTATVSVELAGDDAALTLHAEALADGKTVGEAAVPVTGRHAQVVIELAEKHLWEPGHPFLYDLVLTLRAGDQAVDRLESYFGLRTVSISGRRILINGRPVFQRLILDQGFYPDGIWTAPSDAALKHDIELAMAAGFNGARLHQKVFDPRYLYWADRLGYLVWGEFPNWGMDYGPASHAPYVSEWIEVVQRDRNHPALVGWCPFNETGPDNAALQQVVWSATKALDPARPLLETSGWTHTVPHPEVRDSHDYEGNPAVFRQRWQDFFQSAAARLAVPVRYGFGPVAQPDLGVPFMISEYGGIGWSSGGGWGYGAGPKSLEEFYARYQGLTDALLDNPNLFGFCYTQLTDVEQERNGLYYYDRRPKFDAARLRAITSRAAAYETGGATAPLPRPAADPQWQVLVGGAPDDKLNQPYRISGDVNAQGWNRVEFDDRAWATGRSSLGSAGWRHPTTDWKDGGRLLRRHFAGPHAGVRRAALVLSSTSSIEVCLNGGPLLRREKTSDFEMIDVTERFDRLIKPGDNVLAIRLAPDSGSEPFFDCALLVE